MEKSIEEIWKEGFLKKDALVAPKLNDLYNQKSIHLIDEFRRMYRFNLRFLVIFAFFVLLISFPTRMQYMGVPVFFIFIGVVVFSKKHLDSAAQIDKNATSYLYLKAYQNWLKERISLFTKVYKYIYPLIFLSIVMGFWFLKIGENSLGGNFVEWLILEFPNIYLIGGIPVFVIVGVIILMGLISYFSERMYLIDFKALYGKLMNRLEELIADMEELR